MTAVDPWLEQIIHLFGSLDEALAFQEQTILHGVVSGRSRAVARILKAENTSNNKFLMGSIRQWSNTGLQQSYLNGALSVSGQPLKMTRAERNEFSAIQKDAQNKMIESVRYQGRDTERFVRVARRNKNPTKQWLERNQIKGAKFSDGRRMDVDAYAEMQARAASQKMQNLGVIHAARHFGVQFVECKDGHECGWVDHHDPDKADGKLLPTDGSEEIILISHPYCVRTFLPRPDLNKGLLERLGKKAFSALKSSAITTIEANAIPTVAKMLFVVEDTVVDEETATEIATIGTLESKLLNDLLGRLQRIFRLGQGKDAQIFPFVPEPPEPIDVGAFFGATGTGGPASSGAILQAPPAIKNALSGQASVEEVKDRVLKWGDALLDKRISFAQVPDSVKAAVKATNNDSEGAFMEKVRAFAEIVQKERVKGLTEEGARVINFIAKKKQWNEYIIMKTADRYATEIRGTWTKYGPRVRVDLTDFIRGNVTFTKSGIRRSITLNPAGATRTMLGIAQDGTLIGNLRFVPNHFFSAIAEVNDFGNLESELRFNPFKGGRMRILFESPRPKNWYNEGLIPGQDFVDFREAARSLAGRHQEWTTDLQDLNRLEMQKKWGGDKDFVRFNQILDDMRDDDKLAAFQEKVTEAIDNEFTDNRDVQLWLSVVADSPTTEKKLYKGFIWQPDPEANLPANMTRAEKITQLNREFQTGTRIDEWASDFYKTRGTALDFSEPDEGDIGILYRAVNSRGVPTGALGTAPQDLGDQVIASGAWVVRNSKWDGKIKRYVVDMEYLDPQVGEALQGRRFGVEDFTFRELFGTLKTMRPKDVIFDVPIFNKTIFDMSAELRIPIASVRKFVSEQVDRGLMKFTAGGRYQGMLSFNPGADLVNMISDEAGRSMIQGSISFSNYLPTWASFLDPKIGATWTRTLSEIAGKEEQVQQLIGNVRLSGLEFFERATNLELGQFFKIGPDMFEDFAKAVKNVDAKTRVFLIRNQRSELKLFGNKVLPAGKLSPFQLLRPRDIAPILEKRLEVITARDDVKTRVQAFRFLIDAVREQSSRVVAEIKTDPESGIVRIERIIRIDEGSRSLSRQILREVAAIDDDDTKAIIESKLYDLVFFLRATTMDDPIVHELLDQIEDIDLSRTAYALANASGVI